MNTRSWRKFIVLAACALVGMTAPVALAVTWVLEDTDNIERSTPSQNVWTADGAFRWYHEDSISPYHDHKASFSTALVLRSGVAYSCAHLRIITYDTNGDISKRFPAAGTTEWGYLTHCDANGDGVFTEQGADVLASTLTHRVQFSRATIAICYTRNLTIAPGADCYNFTIHPGD